MTDPSWELVDSTTIVCKLHVLTGLDKVRVIQARACQDFSLANNSHLHSRWKLVDRKFKGVHKLL